MKPSDPPKPVLIAPIGKAKKRTRKKKNKSAAPARHLTIIKSPAERDGQAERKPGPKAESGGEVDDSPAMLFRQRVGRGSSKVSNEMLYHPRLASSSNRGGLRWLRFYRKLAGRNVRRFHKRFTLAQILGVYIGVPAMISLSLCLSMLLAQPTPRAAARPAEHSILPPAELVREVQAALTSQDGRKAKAALAELEKYYPNDPRTFVAGGTVFAHEKKYDEARERYLRALELTSNLPSALINLGEIEFTTGNYPKAAGYYEQAARRLQHNPLVLFRRYLCYSLLGERVKATTVAEQLRLQPNSVEWYFTQASEALRSGNKQEAQRTIATARTLFGERAAAYQESLRKIGWLK